MAALDPGFLQGFAQTWAELKREQEVDPVAVTMAVIAVVKALAPLGLRGFKVLKGMAGGSDNEVQELIEQVTVGPSGSQASATTTTTPSPIEPRKIQFESGSGGLPPEEKDKGKRFVEKC